jgi:hypothetical protein
VSVDDPTGITGLWIQAHGLSSYPNKGSVRINGGSWISLNNSTAQAQFPESSYGGIGGAYFTIRFTVPLPPGTVHVGSNTIDFKFNQTDGISIGWRVLKFNFQRGDGSMVLNASAFTQEDPNSWKPPLNDAADIAAGKTLWYTAQLMDLSGHLIFARCTNCHFTDGGDLKYFNYSNLAIKARSMAHGLTGLQGEQIASYIRSIDLKLPAGVTQKDLGRPWNPPFQPGPGLDAKPQIEWPAGAGVEWALDSDSQTLAYMFPNGLASPDAAARVDADAMLNQREIPVALQLPDWNHWLPVIHPLDSPFAVHPTSDIYTDFANSKFMQGYDHMKADFSNSATLNSLITQSHNNLITVTNGSSACPGGIDAELNIWWPFYLFTVGTNNTFYLTADKTTPSLDFMSTRQLYAVKQMELHLEYGLFDRARDAYPYNNGRAFLYNDWLAFGVSPHVSANAQFLYPFDSPIKEQYLATAWYETQRIINPGNKVAHAGGPIDFNYQSPHVVGLSLLSGVPHGYMLAIDEFTSLQQASSPPYAWERCDDHSSGQLLYAPKNSMPSRLIFEPALDCIGPDYLGFDPADWRDLDALFVNAFADKMAQRPNFASWPRLGSVTPGSSYVPTLNTATTDSCSSNDISVPDNTYQSLQYMGQLGVDPAVIQRLADWGAGLWPLANWNYWK